MAGDGPTNKAHKLAEGLAEGRSVRQAAEAAGLAHTTARRMIDKPGFRARVSTIRHQIISRSVGVKSLLLLKADAALAKLLDSADEEVRLKAYRELHSSFVALYDAADVAERLALLEARANETTSAYLRPPSED